ncbi:hypothetical protein LDENG_00148970 [Lucifuga dentata]|nr:hypothetical protein LDENG_00148970 [Lucifuga dentata]
MQSDRDRCDISVPTHFHNTSHRLGVTHIPLLWSCPSAAGHHNDARLNLAIALTVARYGAAIANYTEVVHLLKRADSQTGEGEGLRSTTMQGRQEFDVRAKCVINATGPFTDALWKMDDQKNPDICQLRAGVHIVIPGYYSTNNAELLDTAAMDSHIIFLQPWDRMHITGSPDTPPRIPPSLWRMSTST